MFDVVVAPGATAQSIVNPNSKTDALSMFSERLESAKRWQHLLMLLGEVDCGFVIWYRAEKYDVPVEAQLDLSLRNYLDFVDQQIARGFEVHVLSAPLPTIADDQTWGEVANLRRDVKATQRERTALTITYNERLRTACHRRGIAFLDATTAQLDQKTGIIKSELLNEDLLDRHLNPDRYAEIIRQAMASASAPEPAA